MISSKISRKGDGRTTRSYLAFLLRQNWPALVTNTILFLILNVVILSLGISEIMEQGSGLTYENILDYARVMRVVNAVVASLLAVIWGSLAMSYVNSRVSVHFYHTVPLTRGALYVSEISVKLICFAVPALLSHLLSICLTGVMSAYFTWELCSVYLSSFGYALLYFVFFFSVMIFCASFTGNPFARLMSAGMVVFMPSALIACAVSVLSYSAYYSYYDHILQYALELLMPMRVIARLEDVGDLITPLPGEEIFTVLFALAFFVAGYFIYRKRKSEQSGQPVLSKIAAALIKYTCMFCAAVLCGLMFRSFTDDSLWYCIGAVIGAFLAMMLLNVLLTKSAKNMFSGIPGMGIFSAAFLVFFVLFGVDVIGYDRYIPSETMTHSLSVEVEDYEAIPIEDAEDRAYLLNFLRDFMSEPESSYRYPSGEARTKAVTDMTGDGEDALYEAMIGEMTTDMLNTNIYVDLYIRIQPKIGLPIEKRLYVRQALVAEFLTRIANTDTFAEHYFPAEETQYGEMEIAEKDSIVSGYIKLEDTDAVWSYLNRQRESYNGAAYFQRSAVSRFSVRTCSDSGRYTWIDMEYYDDTEEMETLIGSASAVFVYNYKTEKMTEYTAQDDIRAICENLAYTTGYASSRYASAFTVRDPDYVVGVVYGTAAEYSSGERSYCIGQFIDGCVPSFVK